MENNDMLTKLKELLNSKEGMESAAQYFQKLKQKDEILISQLDRFHKKYSNNLEYIIDKIINKYDTWDYKYRWYQKHREPEYYLYYFILQYSKIYGSECNDDEWKEYGCDFTAELRYIDGYYISLIVGQGSFVDIIKINNL